MSDVKFMEKEYPCLAAVNRCANGESPFLTQLSAHTHSCLKMVAYFRFARPPAVPRHQARVIKLQYCGDGPIQKTLMLVGKVRPQEMLSEVTRIKLQP